MSNPLLCLRVIDDEPPRSHSGWRPVFERESWERHYLIGPRHSLCLSQASRVVLTARGSHEGFATESVMLDASFPFDWMALNVIATALPRRLRGLEIDGSDPQAFVDSMAVPELVQASVHRSTRLAVLGATTMEVSALEVPQWSARAYMTTFESRNAHALRATVASAGYGTRQHQNLADWLQGVAAANTPQPAPRQRFAIAS